MKTFQLLGGSLLALILSLFTPFAGASPLIILPAGSQWRYLADGTDPGSAWRGPAFNDSAWSSGAAQLGFGDGDEVTTLQPGIITAYFRRTFQYAASGTTTLTLRLLRDDGAAVYVNGVEVFRNNMPPGPVSYSTLATATVGGAEETTQFITAQINPNMLVQGNNLVAVEVHQVNVTSSDLSFDLELIAESGSALPTVNVVATDSDAAESGVLAAIFPGTFTLSRSGSITDALSVSFTLTGSAENGADYNYISNAVRFNPGQAQARVDIYPRNDGLVEGTENVVLTLEEPACAAVVPPPPGCYRVGPSNRAEIFIRDSDSRPNQPPYVQLNEPRNGDIFQPPTNIVLRAFAHDAEDGYQLRVEFFAGANSLGLGEFVASTCPAPYCPYYELVWANPPPGSHTLIARATDSAGASSNSAPVNITVSMPDMRWVWARQDGGDGFDTIQNAACDQAGNVYVLGHTSGTMVIGTNHLPFYGSSDGYLAKYNNAGRLLWAHSFGGPGYDGPIGLGVDAAGNAYASGQFEGTAFFGPYRLTAETGHDLFLAKFSPGGHVIWATRAKCRPGLENSTLSVDAAGNAVVIGQCSESDHIGDIRLGNFGGNDAMIVKFDSAGNVLWATNAGGSRDDSFMAAAIDPAGNILATGYYVSNAVVGTTHLVSTNGSSQGFMAKFSPSGEVIWARNFAGSWDIGADLSGNYYLTLSFSSPVTIAGQQFTPLNALDFLLVKVSADGDVLWATQGRGQGSDRAEGVKVGADNQPVVAGSFSQNIVLGGTTLTSTSEGLFVAKFADNGSLRWAQKADNAHDGALAVDSEGNAYVGGYFAGTARFGSISLANTTSQYQSFVAQLGTGITKQDPMLTWNKPADISYGTALGATQLNAEANVPGTFEYDPLPGTVLSSSLSQPLHVTFTPADSRRYNSIAAEVGISVRPVPLTIRADNKSRLQGVPNPPLTATYIAFVNGETAQDLDIRPLLSTTATTSSAPGDYPITVSGASDRNYSITYENGTLTVLPRPTPGFIPAPHNQEWPAVATDGVNFFVVWMDRRNFESAWTDYDIYAARISATGELLDRAGIPICTHTATQWYPSVAFDGTNFLVVWSDDRDNVQGTPRLEIYGARVSRDGRVLDTNGFQLTHGEIAYQPVVAFNNRSAYLVAAYARQHNGESGDTAIAVRVTPAGVVLDTEEIVLSGPEATLSPVVLASVGGNWLAAWNYGGIQGALVSENGSVSLPRYIGNRGDTWMRGLTAVGNNYFLTMRAYRQLNPDTVVMDLYGTWIDAAGQPFRTVLVSSNTSYSTGSGSGQPTIHWQDHATAAGNSEALVVWEAGAVYTNGGNQRWTSNIRGARVATDGTVSAPISICSAPQDQAVPSLAFNGQHFLAVWQDARSAPPQEENPFSAYDIYGARVSTTGNVLEPNGFLISSAASNRPPQISIIVPGDGTVFDEGRTIRIEAVTTDPDGFASTVEFFANEQKIGETTASPGTPGQPLRFEFNWTDAPIGQQRLTARTVDNGGARATSVPVNITVREPDNHELHIVGIYSGAVIGDGSHEEGRAAVFVDRPGKLVTLFLSAYEPVLWSITASPETTIEKVYLVGYYPGRVEGIGPNVEVIREWLNYYVGWSLNQGLFYRIAPKVRRLTGLEISSFQGASTAPTYPTPFPIDTVPVDERLLADYPVPTPLSELPQLNFTILFQGGSAGVVPVTYTLAGPDGGGDLLPRGERALLGNDGRYYSLGDENLLQIEADGTSRELPIPADLPQLNSPIGIAYDSVRDRVLLVTDSGEGLLYAYTPGEDRWSVLSTMNGFDLGSLTYHVEEDMLYGLGQSHPDGTTQVILHRFTPDGVPTGEFRLPLYPWGVDRNSSQLVSVDGYLVLLLNPTDTGDLNAEDEESRMYLVYPAPSEVWLTARQPRPIQPNQPVRVSITAPAQGAVFEPPASIQITATAEGTTSFATKVEFFANGLKIGEQMIPPETGGYIFNFTWQNVPAGTYMLTAKATDSRAGTSMSPAVNITVEPLPVQPAPGDQETPAVAANDEFYFVVWASSLGGGEWDIYGARMTAEGRCLDPNGIRICTAPGAQTVPAVASDGRDFLVAWHGPGATYDDIYGARVTAEGVVLDPNGFLISGAASSQFGASLAFNGTHYLVTWYDYRNSDDAHIRNDIYGARVGRDGVVLDPNGIAICTAENMQWAPGVAALGDDFFVAWDDSRWQERGTRVSSDGVVSNPDGLVLSPNFSGYGPAVAANASGYLAVWTDSRNYETTQYDIFGRRVSAAGEVIGSSDLVLCNAPGMQVSPALAAGNDQFLAVWIDDRGGFDNRAIFAARIGTSGVLDLNGFPIGHGRVSEGWRALSVGSLNGQYLAAWTRGFNSDFSQRDIVAVRVTADGEVLDPDPILVSTAILPLDSDHDGVPDDLDDCPGTPSGEIVDANGCSDDQRDSDNDGVPDSRDQCPDTLTGTFVDANGCPRNIVGWGCNFAGETEAPPGLVDVISLAGGQYHTLALKRDGSLVAWGRNDRGQNDVPPEATGIRAIASLRFHDLAVTRGGKVIAWGFNHSGQTDVPEGLSNVVAVAAGFSHSLALKSDGTVVGWGDNFFHQSTPPQDLRNVRAISAGATHSLALKSDGTLVAWGDNMYGQTNIPAGLAHVVAIASGVYQSYALKRDGTVVGWGWNVATLEGLNDVIAIAAGGDHLVALKRDRTVVSGGYYECDDPIPQPALSNVTAIAAGGDHSLAILGRPIGPACACDAPWRNHAEYVTCVVRHAWELFRAGLITRDQRRDMIHDAVQSNCGRHPDHGESVCMHLFPLTREECEREGMQFVISGDATGPCVLECSEDLVNWRTVEPVSITGWEITCPMESGTRARFYRVRAE